MSGVTTERCNGCWGYCGLSKLEVVRRLFPDLSLRELWAIILDSGNNFSQVAAFLDIKPPSLHIMCMRPPSEE